METEKHDSTPTPAQRHVDPLDLALARFKAFIEQVESERAKAEELAKVPEDIPRYVTRYEP